jgi:hypothetical protein
LLALVAGVAGTGCAGFRDARHLAPIYSEVSTAGGGREIDALGGAVIVRRSDVDGPVDYWGFRPLVTWRRQKPGHTLTWFLAPFGSSRRSPERFTWQLLPIARYDKRRTDAGGFEWTFLALPGIYWSRFEDGRTVRAWFPFGGRVERFLSFDRLDFVLWPLFTRSERQGRINWHFLWPFFGYSQGTGAGSWRFWPLYVYLDRPVRTFESAGRLPEPDSFVVLTEAEWARLSEVEPAFAARLDLVRREESPRHVFLLYRVRLPAVAGAVGGFDERGQ